MSKQRRLQLLLGVALAASFALPWHVNFLADDLRNRYVLGWRSPFAIPLVACLIASLLISVLEGATKRRGAFAHAFLFGITSLGMMATHLASSFLQSAYLSFTWGAWLYFVLSAGFYGLNFMIRGARIEPPAGGSYR